MLKLTDQGRKEVSNFVQKCEEFRKELLETGRDTGHIGPPDAGTVEKYAVQKGSVNGVYEESWHVADNYCLRIILYVNKDFIELRERRMIKMLNDLVYLVAFMSVFFIGLGTVTLAVEKIPFLHKMTIRLINAMTFNENDKIPEDWDGKDKE